MHISFKRWTAWAVAMGLLITLAAVPRPVGAQVQLDLRDADLRSFVEIVAEATGRSYVLDPDVRGTVTVLTPEDVSPQELKEIFLSVLELNRLTIVEGVGSDRIVQMATARELATGSRIGVADGAFETRVIAVEHVPVPDVIEVVRPLLPSEAVISAVPNSNLLILSDRGQNHRRIVDLIAKLDTPRDEPIELIRLRNADAREVLQVIQGTDLIPAGSSVTVDVRSNALVVSGPIEFRRRVRLLSGRLDTQTDNLTSTAVTLRFAEAGALADVVLRSLADGGPDTQSEIRIVSDPATNSLLITAPQDRIDDIHAMIRYLDRRPAQVLVEAVIFEMSVEGFADLSVQFAGLLDSAIIGGAQFALEGRQTLTSVISAVVNGDTPDVGSGGVIGFGPSEGETGVAGLVTAIASTQSTRLLSTPSIMTLNNQEAEIVVAQNVPFVTGSFTSTGDGSNPDNPFQTIERQDVGLTLNVTPQINADRTVKMEIQQEVSNLTTSSASAGGEITARRALSTTVLVQDGNVVLLGGLLENGSGKTEQRVPGLSELPLVGGLFRGKNTSKNQRVLLVLLRPKVVTTEAEAQATSRAVAREAKAVSLAIAPADDRHYPQTPSGGLPFDGMDLNQPFDAGFVDDIAQSRNYPPLPSRLRFSGQ